MEPLAERLQRGAITPTLAPGEPRWTLGALRCLMFVGDDELVLIVFEGFQAIVIERCASREVATARADELHDIFSKQP